MMGHTTRARPLRSARRWSDASFLSGAANLFGCSGRSTTSTVVRQRLEREVPHADEPRANGGWWYGTREALNAEPIGV